MTEHENTAPETEDVPLDEGLARTLRAQRPAPDAAFGAEVRERLHALRWGPSRPAHLWLLVAAWVSCGILLLLLAALGAAGSGPFS
jgi:hypothetical protein